MKVLLLTSTLSFDFDFTALLHEHGSILIMGILVLFLSGILLAVRTFAIQLILLFLFFASEETFSNPLYILLVVLQIALGLWVLWGVKKAVDTTFYRQSEKTLKRPRDITKAGNSGIGPFLY